jgi:hypothetical protein
MKDEKVIPLKGKQVESAEAAGLIIPKESRPHKEIKQLLSPEKRMCRVPDVDVPYSTVITSCHSQNLDHAKLIVANNDISHRQVVVAAGPNAWVNVGDWVMINVDMFPKTQKPGKHDTGNVIIVHPPTETIGSTQYLYLTDRHIKYRYKRDD